MEVLACIVVLATMALFAVFVNRAIRKRREAEAEQLESVPAYQPWRDYDSTRAEPVKTTTKQRNSSPTGFTLATAVPSPSRQSIPHTVPHAIPKVVVTDKRKRTQLRVDTESVRRRVRNATDSRGFVDGGLMDDRFDDCQDTGISDTIAAVAFIAEEAISSSYESTQRYEEPEIERQRYEAPRYEAPVYESPVCESRESDNGWGSCSDTSSSSSSDSGSSDSSDW